VFRPPSPALVDSSGTGAGRGRVSFAASAGPCASALGRLPGVGHVLWSLLALAGPPRASAGPPSRGQSHCCTRGKGHKAKRVKEAAIYRLLPREAFEHEIFVVA